MRPELQKQVDNQEFATVTISEWDNTEMQAQDYTQIFNELKEEFQGHYERSLQDPEFLASYPDYTLRLQQKLQEKVDKEKLNKNFIKEMLLQMETEITNGKGGPLAATLKQQPDKRLFDNSVKKKVEGKGKWGRNFKITTDFFANYATSEHDSDAPGFLKKAWIHTKSLFGAEIKRNAPSVPFNDNLTIFNALVTQKKENGKRMFTIKSDNQGISLFFSKMDPETGKSWGKSLYLNNASFYYKYNITDDENMEDTPSLKANNLKLDYKGFHFYIKMIKGIFDDRDTILYVENCLVDLPNTNIFTNCDGTVSSLKISKEGLKWKNASINADNIKIGNIAEFKKVLLAFNKDTEDSKANIQVLLGEVDFDFGPKLNNVEANYNPNNGDFSVDIADVNIPLSSKVMGMDLTVTNLHASVNNLAVSTDNAAFSLIVKNDFFDNFQVTGNVEKLSWSNQGVDFETITANLENKVKIGGFTLDKTQLTIEKNKSNLKTITVNTGIKQDIGGVETNVSGELRAIETGEGKWDILVGGEKGATGNIGFQGDLFALNLEGEGITYSDQGKQIETIDQQGNQVQVRERELKAKKLKGTVNALDTELSATLDDFQSDGKTLSYSKLTLRGANFKIGDYFEVSQLVMTEEAKQLATSDGEAQKTSTKYKIEVLKAKLGFDKLGTELDLKGEALVEKNLLPEAEKTDSEAVEGAGKEEQKSQTGLTLKLTGENKLQIGDFKFDTTIKELEMNTVTQKGSVKEATVSLSLPFGEKGAPTSAEEVIPDQVEGTAKSLQADISGTLYNLTWEPNKVTYEKIDGTLNAGLSLLDLQVGANAHILIHKPTEKTNEAVITGDIAVQKGKSFSGSLTGAKITATEIEPKVWNYNLTGIDKDGAKAALSMQAGIFGLNLAGEDITYSDQVSSERKRDDQGKLVRERQFNAKKLEGTVNALDTELNATLDDFQSDGKTLSYSKLTLRGANFKIGDYFEVSQLVMTEEAKQLATSDGEAQKTSTKYKIEVLKAKLGFDKLGTELDLKGEALVEKNLLPEAEKTDSEAVEGAGKEEQKSQTGLTLKLTGENKLQIGDFNLGMTLNQLDLDTARKKGKVKEAAADMDLSLGEASKVVLAGNVENFQWEPGKKQFDKISGNLNADINLFALQIKNNTHASIELYDKEAGLRRVKIEQNLNLIAGNPENVGATGEITDGELVATETSKENWDYELNGAPIKELTNARKKMKASAHLQLGDLGLDVSMEGLSYRDVLNTETEMRERSLKAEKASASLCILDNSIEGNFKDLKYDDKGWSFKELSFALGNNFTLGNYFSVATGKLTVIPPEKDEEKAIEQVDAEVDINQATLDLGIAKYTLSMKGSAKNLAAKEVEKEGQKLTLPDGWLFNFSSINSEFKPGDDAANSTLKSFGLSLNMNEFELNTQERKGKLNRAGFTGNLFNTTFSGSVKDLSWDEKGCQLGQWEATVPKVTIGELINVGSTTFTMKQENGQTVRRLTSELVSINYPQGKTGLFGKATSMSYDLEKEIFTADTLGFTVNIAKNALKVSLNKVNISKQGFKFAGLASKLSLNLFEGAISINEIGLETGENNTDSALEELKFSGSVAIAVSGIEFNTNNAVLIKKLGDKKNNYSGIINDLTMSIGGMPGFTAHTVTFDNNKFQCLFASAKSLNENIDTFPNLLNPLDTALFGLKKLFSRINIMPQGLSYTRGEGFKLLKIPQEQIPDQPLEDNMGEDFKYLKGNLKLSDLENSDVKFDLKFPEKFDEKDPINSAFNFLKLKAGIFDVGFASIYVGFTPGFGYKFSSQKLNPKLKNANGQETVALSGDVDLSGIAYAEINAGIQLGLSLFGAGAEVYGQAIADFKADSSKLNMDLMKEDQGYRLVGDENSLIVPLKAKISAQLGARAVLKVLGKDKKLKDVVFSKTKKTFGYLTGKYKYNLGSAQNKLITLEELKFTPQEDIKDKIMSLQDGNQEEYKELLKKADALLLPPDENSESPRELWVEEIQKATDEVEQELVNSRNDAYIIQVELIEYSAKTKTDLEEAKKHIKKHEYRLKNEELFQEGLQNWNPSQKNLPTYEQYDLSALGRLKTYLNYFKGIPSSIRNIKNSYSDRNYKVMLITLQNMVKKGKEVFSEKPPKVRISDGNDFYETMVPGTGAYSIFQKELKNEKNEHGIRGVHKEVSKKLRNTSWLSDNSLSDSTRMVRWLAYEKLVQDNYGLNQSPVNFKDAVFKAGDRKVTRSEEDAIDSLNRYAAKILREHYQYKYDVAPRSVNTGFDSITYPSRSIKDRNVMLSHETLQKIYSSNAIKKALEEINRITATNYQGNEESTEQSPELKENKEIKDMLTDGSLDKTKRNALKKMLIHKFVKKHTHSRISFYQQKFELTEVKIEQYKTAIEVLNKQQQELADRKDALQQLLARKIELVSGGPIVRSITDAIDKNKTDSQTISKSRLAVNTEVNSQTSKIEGLVQEIKTAYKQDEKEFEANPATEHFLNSLNQD